MNSIIKDKKYLNKIWRPLPGKSIEPSRLLGVRLDKNECLDMDLINFLYKEIINKVTAKHFSIYPEVEILYKRISRELNLPINYIFLSAGSDISIRSIFEVFVGHNDKVIIPDPTFIMYSIYCEVFRAKSIKIDYDKNLILPINKIYKAINNKPVLLILSNPDSPTGSIINRNKLKKIISFAQQNGVIVLIDEAYYPYYSSTIINWIKNFDNLIITRTFSKAYGLAGLRIGYSIGNPDIIKLLYAQKPMYEVNMFGIIAALVVFDNIHLVVKSIESIKKSKKYFSDKLNKMGFKVKNGHANFILVNFGSKHKNIFYELKKHKILFKESFEHASLKGFSRFSIGPKDTMKKVVDIIKNI